ncbi:glucosaminidase domain-containing protein [Chloroflexus sp.]|uniref:glucosaminidase domain-containing protein n=1 Tax=Chloroflexus sp. TaxID=1904827 RepID=UPI002618FE43|nr:glucosaminidase domain-containing protein [uncultured Chloroflexus sp.]
MKTRLTRRTLLGVGLAALSSHFVRGQEPELNTTYLPFVARSPLPGVLLGPPTGTAAAAIAWLAPRSTAYTPYDVEVIVNGYAEMGDAAGIDWFLAIAQCAHETGHLTSWWCQRPRRNPAGIGVTGEIREGTPDQPPGPDWAWDESIQRWRAGLSFASWVGESIPAHLGRLLAYALPAGDGTPYQQQLIDYALFRRPLPASLRGVAVTITDLNGRWAVPGTEYGQRILDLAERMRATVGE